ncbi:acyl-CoA dehydrogenase family protein [bacterium]|nr:acyl-CoA dehydrogenase family protein [bacterium]
MAASHNALDLYKLDELFSDEERIIRSAVLDWVKERFMPLIEEHYEAGTFPLELVPELAELGVFGATLPEQYGCAGVSHTAYGLINQALEYGDSGLRSFVSVQSGLVMYPIYAFGSEEQRMKWLPELAAGRRIGCFGLTEPNHGSNPGGMETRAMPVDGGYLLNGAKAWITNGCLSDVAVVWAKVGPDSGDQSADSKTIRGFLVEKGMPGFSTAEYKKKLSLRASVTSELYFKDVFVPEANMLPNVQGLKGPLSCLNQARYGIAWGATGAGMYCLEAALRYAGERSQFGRPIAGFQLQQLKLSQMATELLKGQLLCWRLGKLKEAGTVTPAQISIAKRDNVYQARECARMAREIYGAMGIMLESHVMRHSNNLESVLTYEGTHDVHHLILGEAITGLSAFGG